MNTDLVITTEQLTDWQAMSRDGVDICTDLVSEVLTLNPSQWGPEFWKQADTVRRAVIAFNLHRLPAHECVLAPASRLLDTWCNYESEDVWVPMWDALLVAVVNAPAEQLPASLRLVVVRVHREIEVEA